MSVSLGTNAITFSDASTQATASVAPATGQCVTIYQGPSPVSTTWTKPATCKGIKVTLIASGGNSQPSPYVGNQSRYSSGGGGAGAAFGWFPGPNIPGPVTVTIGTPGNPASFGSLISATAGGIGSVGNNTPGDHAGGIGGTGTGGQFQWTGTAGGIANSTDRGGGYTNIMYGNDSQALFGGGPVGTPNVVSPGVTNPYYGGGASGSINTNNGGGTATGATGGPGLIIIEEFY